MSCLCSGNCFRRELPAGVVDGVGRIEDQLTDGHNGIPVVDQAVEDGRQGLRRVQRSVVEQHDAPRLHLGCYAPAYRIRVVVLPVQGVPIGKDLKPLRRKGLRVWRRCALGKNLTCKRGVWRVFQERERSKSRGCAQRASIAMPTVPLKKILTRQRSRPISNRAAFLLRTHIITACLGQNVSASYFSLKLVDFSLLSGYNKGASYFGPKEAEQCILRDSLKKSLQQ